MESGALRCLTGVRWPNSCKASRGSSLHSQCNQILFRQFAKPMQRDRGLRIIDLMAATKSPDSNPLKAGSLDRTHDGVLLLQSRDSILVPATNVNRCVEKICAGLQF